MNKNYVRKMLLLASLVTSCSLHAEIVEIDEVELAEMTGQSGLLIEAGFGGAADKTDITNVGWSSAGITVEAFKWEFDLENYDSATNVHGTVLSGIHGGFVAENIQLAGALDINIDTSRDAGGRNAIGFNFSNSNIDMRVGNMAAYTGSGGVGESMGSIEVLTLNIDGLDLFISGNGVSNP